MTGAIEKDFRKVCTVRRSGAPAIPLVPLIFQRERTHAREEETTPLYRRICRRKFIQILKLWKNSPANEEKNTSNKTPANRRLFLAMASRFCEEFTVLLHWFDLNSPCLRTQESVRGNWGSTWSLTRTLYYGTHATEANSGTIVFSSMGGGEWLGLAEKCLTQHG